MIIWLHFKDTLFSCFLQRIHILLAAIAKNFASSTLQFKRILICSKRNGYNFLLLAISSCTPCSFSCTDTVLRPP
ncbi:hypothetical protein L1887_01135 [Cichorium endivia]|nr:hypothetical protein L1887_01135 [Cichorium endivia]